MSAVRRRSALALLCLALASCRPASPAVSPARPAVPPVVQLQRDLDRLLASPGLERAGWGVHVRSLGADEVLYAAGARKLLMPASTLKLVTLAAAAEVLGWDHTFETRMFSAGPVDSGRLDGDLVVVGTGDPSIDDWEGAATGLFAIWAGRLKSVGIHAISGRIIGDDRAFGEEGLGAGWAWDDLGTSYATRIGALQFNQNTARLEIGPAAGVGEPAIVREVTVPGAVVYRNRLTTAAPDAEPRFVTRREPGRTGLELRGAIALASAPTFVNVSVDNPTQYFVSALRQALVENGVEVGGPAVDVDAAGLPLPLSDSVPLIVHRSPPLATLAQTMMRFSQNLYAETLLRALGRDAGSFTADAGREAISSRLVAWGIDPGDLLLADGSGLSRYNLATAGALTAVLAHVFDSDQLRDPFLAALPAAGRDGTLALRLEGTAAEGNVRAKTGSFSNARSLAGYVWTADREPLAFAITANNFGSAAGLVDGVVDAVVVRLAEFSRQ